LLSISIGKALSIVIPMADLIIILFGILLLLNINPFKRLPQIQVPVLSHPFVNAFIYGLLYGPIALPCSGPLVVSIFALSLTVVEAFSKLNIFFWFGLGFGIPLLLLSFLSGAAQRWITRQFAIRARLINVISGLLLLGVGIYDFRVNWPLLQLYLS
jgi:cytochrome c-type biogenesis protein